MRCNFILYIIRNTDMASKHIVLLSKPSIAMVTMVILKQCGLHTLDLSSERSQDSAAFLARLSAFSWCLYSLMSLSCTLSPQLLGKHTRNTRNLVLLDIIVLHSITTATLASTQTQGTCNNIESCTWSDSCSNTDLNRAATAAAVWKSFHHMHAVQCHR